MSFRAAVDWFKRPKRKFIVGCGLFVLIIIISDKFIFPLPLDQLYKPSATFIYSRDRTLLGAYISSDSYWRKPLKLSDISPLLQKSVLVCEDRWFYYHPGVNPVSLIQAAYDDIKAGKIVRGGSTITMQIARMMEPKSRTLKAKIIEMLRAFQLELHFSKKELLELYFNMAPYGGNIEGVGAASYFYFGKPARELTASQAALLTSIPNSPQALRPDINLANSLNARKRVLGVMRANKIISENDYREALDEEIKGKKYKLPNIAPHLCNELLAKYRGSPEITCAVDLKTQSICEAVVNNFKGSLAMKGINNIAVVVIKNSTAEVVAMVGSCDFYDIQHEGQVNGATAPRSPGSALKPFVYGMALDKGLVSPNMVIEDVPAYYSGYTPENYDRQYRGAVSVADALRNSLNVPAVHICAKVGQKNFFALLKKGGLSTLTRKDSDYGLPLILGSCEIELLDLTTLYSCLARGGVYKKYHYLLDESSVDSVRLFSPAAAYILAEIMSELERPDFPSSWEFSPNIPKAAWKTGTSYGRKDAWSIGFNPTFTVGVWAGNFNGEPSPDLVGAEAAAPILFEIFRLIDTGSARRWFAEPITVDTRKVCAVSGMPPGPHCAATVDELYIPGVSPVTTCTIHKEILIDSLSGYRLCRYCSSGKHVKHVVYEDWPPKIATWLVKSGHAIAPIPEHNPDCTGTYAGDRPVINSPTEDVTYIIRGHIPLADQGITLEASVAAGSKKIYWFIDGELYAEAAPGQKVFYVPVPGSHKLVCTDDEGRSSSLIFTVSSGG
ncbi:MAG: penicillin-binding protein 1C [candidate division Zixibacteria bacterium]|nr:penicillin-binding protein 1C [candidate division Zixibacteria bacterium]